MTATSTTKALARESKLLVLGGFIALSAAEFAGGVYAWQTASAAQTLTLLGVAIPTDAVLKTVLNGAAGLCLLFGPAIAWHKLRAGRKNQGMKREAIIAVAASLTGLCIATGNLSGYFAHTRGQAEAGEAAANPLYAVAASHAALAASDVRYSAYLSSADRALLAAATPKAERDVGDVGKALGLLLLIAAMGSAYRLPEKPAAARRGGRRSTRRKHNDTSELDVARSRKRG